MEKDDKIVTPMTQNIDLALFSRATLDEKESERIASAPYSYWKTVFKTFLHKPSAVIGLVCLILMIIGIIVIPLITPIKYFNPVTGQFDFNDNTVEDFYQLAHMAPSLDHLFGTDEIGRDIFFMCWTGLRKSIILALISSIINIVVGTLVGLAWGFIRALDPILIEVYNLVSNIPSLLLYMLIAMVLNNLNNTGVIMISPEAQLVIALSLTGWLGVALFIRNQTLIITNRDYNVASKTLGTPTFRIMIKNLLPYLMAIIITEFSLMLPGMISSELSLSYFGVGLSNKTISLGSILSFTAKNFEIIHWWELVMPSLMLAFVIFTFYLLGLALSDSLNPKKHN